MADPMFGIPRPKTRGDCQQEARPCPWVACRHHLLIEVAKAKPRKRANGAPRESRATTIRINRATTGRTPGGRRPGLGSSAAADLVNLWVDEAIEQLAIMPYSCALDVADAHPDGIPPRRIGWLLGVTEQAIDAEGRKPEIKAALAKLREYL